MLMVLQTMVMYGGSPTAVDPPLSGLQEENQTILLGMTYLYGIHNSSHQPIHCPRHRTRYTLFDQRLFIYCAIISLASVTYTFFPQGKGKTLARFLAVLLKGCTGRQNSFLLFVTHTIKLDDPLLIVATWTKINPPSRTNHTCSLS